MKVNLREPGPVCSGMRRGQVFFVRAYCDALLILTDCCRLDRNKEQILSMGRGDADIRWDLIHIVKEVHEARQYGEEQGK